MSAKFFTNAAGNTLLKKFAEVSKYNPLIAKHAAITCCSCRLRLVN